MKSGEKKNCKKEKEDSLSKGGEKKKRREKKETKQLSFEKKTEKQKEKQKKKFPSFCDEVLLKSLLLFVPFFYTKICSKPPRSRKQQKLNLRW